VLSASIKEISDGIGLSLLGLFTKP
jgi:hypothetical protein